MCQFIIVSSARSYVTFLYEKLQVLGGYLTTLSVASVLAVAFRRLKKSE
jgi:hypothetical protein